MILAGYSGISRFDNGIRDCRDPLVEEGKEERGNQNLRPIQKRTCQVYCQKYHETGFLCDDILLYACYLRIYKLFQSWQSARAIG